MLSEADSTVLPRTLRLRDLVFLKVAAIVNLSFVPPTAVFGRVAIGLWALAFFAFFVPEAIAVLTYARRYPGEGGIYLWTRRQFGEVHGFLSGWCYWTNNLFYLPMQLVYIAGVLAYVGGGRWADLVDEKWFVSIIVFGWLALATGANIRGLGVGKWVQNVGAIAAATTAILIVAAAGAAWLGGRAAHPPLTTGLGWQTMSAFSVMCFAFVGIELASTMGDEIEHPERDLPRAIYITGAVALTLYILATLAVLWLVPIGEMGVIQGIMQALDRGTRGTGAAWLITPVALAMAMAIGGGASAWLAGSARVPFVAGLDNALPRALGNVHPRWNSPHVALLATGGISALLMSVTLVGSSVAEAYQVLLKAGVVIQLVPFVYLFFGLFTLDNVTPMQRAAGLIGLCTSLVGIVFAFIPAGSVDNAMVYEAKMIVGCVAPTAIGLLLFSRARRKVIHP